MISVKRGSASSTSISWSSSLEAVVVWKSRGRVEYEDGEMEDAIVTGRRSLIKLT